MGFLHLDFTKNANKDGSKINPPTNKNHKNPSLGMAAKGALPVLSMTFETAESQKLIQTAANPHPMASPPSDPSMSITQITDFDMTEMEEQAFNSSNLFISRTFPDYFPSYPRFSEAIPNTSNHGPIHGPSPGPNLLYSPTSNNPFPNFLARDRPNEPSNPSTSGMAGDQVQGNNPRPMLLSTNSDERVESRSHKLRPEHMVVNTNETNQPNPNSSIISGDAECRNDPHGVIPAISPCKNSINIKEGPSFCVNTWGSPKSGVTILETSILVDSNPPPPSRGHRNRTDTTGLKRKQPRNGEHSGISEGPKNRRGNSRKDNSSNLRGFHKRTVSNPYTTIHKKPRPRSCSLIPQDWELLQDKDVTLLKKEEASERGNLNPGKRQGSSSRTHNPSTIHDELHNMEH
ncbi:hypothetical protein FXO37_03503 [Capsicum annuum]|nr:hypothetical protein FXO37_03503 [Capsicum annuum]